MKFTLRIVLCTLLTAPILAQDSKAISPQDAFQAHVQKAETFLREKRPDLAIPELQAAVSIAPDNLQAQANLGVLLFFAGKPADAIPHLRFAVDRQPDLAKLRGILGIAELRTQQIAQGRTDAEAAFPLVTEEKFKTELGLELVSSYTQSVDLEQAARILAELRKVASSSPEVLYAEYRTYSDLSGEAMLELSMVAPNSAQMHQLLAHEQLKQGNTNAAIIEYRKAIAIDDRLPSVHYELAEVLHSASDPSIKKEAVEEYRIALQQNPNDEKSLCRLAEVELQSGNSKQAYADYLRATLLQPTDADAKLALAQILIDTDKPLDALSVVEDALRLEPTNPVAHYRMSILYKKAGRMEEAKREVELYKQYKDAKEKLRATYKGLLIQPKEIRADVAEEK
ncbi:MAG: tetratricopeptide repeat protein [Terracidiphilus sp.]